MNHVARQEDTDYERNDRRNIGDTGGRNRAELFNDEIVDDVGETRPKQPKTKDQTYPGARIFKDSSDPIETGHEEEEDNREPIWYVARATAGSFSGLMNFRA